MSRRKSPQVCGMVLRIARRYGQRYIEALVCIARQQKHHTNRINKTAGAM